MTVVRAKGVDPEVTVSVTGERASDSRASGVLLLKPGDVVGGKYLIEQWLGQGGMGAVFRATQLLSEKPVALKCMLRPPTHEQARARFLREARAIGRIHHPNVVDIYDVGEADGFDFLVMELLRGESLRARLARGRLAAGEAVDLLLPAMLGIAAAHRAGVIHRDLKPDNVFLCEAGEGAPSQAKVVDFGISQIQSADAGDPITNAGVVLGTPSYMAPEQLRNPHDVDARTDVYAFGVMLYEALTGQLPFRETSYSGLVLAIAESEPPRPSSLAPDLPQALEAVILRAIARDREQRYPDMQSFIAAVRPFGSRYAAAANAAAAIRTGGAAAATIAKTAQPRPWPRRPREHDWRRGVAVSIALAAVWLAIYWLDRERSSAARSATDAVATSVRSFRASETVPPEPAARFGQQANVATVGAREVAPVQEDGDAASRASERSEREPRAASPRASAADPAEGAGAAPRSVKHTRPNAGARTVERAGPVGRSGTISLDDM